MTPDLQVCHASWPVHQKPFDMKGLQPVVIAKDYLNRLRSTHIKPPAMTASATVLGSGTDATRNPTAMFSSVGLEAFRSEGRRMSEVLPNDPPRKPRYESLIKASF